MRAVDAKQGTVSTNDCLIVIFAENASFRSYCRRHLLASNALTVPEPQKNGYQHNPRNVGTKLLFVILTKTLRSEVTAHSLTFFGRISSI